MLLLHVVGQINGTHIHRHGLLDAMDNNIQRHVQVRGVVDFLNDASQQLQHNYFIILSIYLGRKTVTTCQP